jgi:hypothetical protein
LGTGLKKALLNIVSLFEAVNASAGIDQLLLAGIKRMTFRADFNAHFLLGGANLESFPAYAAHRGHLVVGMYLFFHFSHLFA